MKVKIFCGYPSEDVEGMINEWFAIERECSISHVAQSLIQNNNSVVISVFYEQKPEKRIGDPLEC